MTLSSTMVQSSRESSQLFLAKTVQRISAFTC